VTRPTASPNTRKTSNIEPRTRESRTAARQFRIEQDPIGELRVPADAYYGVQTQRAVENFPISGMTAPPELIVATVQIKKAAAEANVALGRLEAGIAGAIVKAADEILAGKLRDQFVVDVYQAGAGTSHNMNANEVLANRAAELLGAPRGDYSRVHPNDHVNMGQSTNDVFPTATRLALLAMIPDTIAAAKALAAGLSAKGGEFNAILKTGRTHLQDAVPMTVGQELGGFAANVAHAAKELERSARQLLELNLGSTAVGTGLNAGNDYTARAVANLAAYTGSRVRPAVNRFRVTQSMGDVLGYSGALRRLAMEVGKVASDLRLLSMGPRAGIAELKLPAVQPGSSIMPGKVNPSVPEMVNQVCFQVFGCDATILAAAEAGQLELNVMMPVIAWNAIHATRILRQAMIVLQERCVAGIEADAARCRELLDRSTAVATALSPYIGYAATADIAKTAVKTGKSIASLVRERQLVPADKLERILSAEAMTSPGVPGSEDDDATPNRQTRARGADPRAAGRRSAAQPALSSRPAGDARRSGSRRLEPAGPDHGQAAHRGGKRRR
jgi:aspartate ammonia-lyase